MPTHVYTCVFSCLSGVEVDEAMLELARVQGMTGVSSLYEAHAEGILKTIKVSAASYSSMPFI